MAKHIGKTANTLDKSEKLDTVRHEHDAQGRTYEGFASKGIAGHALYTSGHGDKTERHVLNTCAGQTTGCGGGTDKNGVVDTSKGTCFAPNAESQYVNAAVRRACHAQAKHDPAMTKDWIIAHTGSMREAADKADKRNTRLLFRPNVVDETDVSSRHVIRGLNKQRAAENKPPITANSYGKTNELHDPENGYYVTYSNVGPKTKHGSSIDENIARDKQRVRSTILAVNGKGEDTVNDDGHKTPPKGSYMVTDVKRDSPMANKMEKTITHAKYWSTGRPTTELTEQEKAEGPMGHFGPNGKPTTPDKAHYGHATLNDKLGCRVLELEALKHDLGGLGFCWIALGSEGRLEQTLATDQDNGIIFTANGPPEQIRERLLPFAQAVNQALDQCGFPLCKGGIMAGNPQWCLSIDEWQARFGEWIRNPLPQAHPVQMPCAVP
ncbi:MAG: hypothetical protein EBY81_06365, partial [Verrucomicrobia bacterium]|nr:hypothetical protein [Verrucomicrobiota bacterium]